MGLPKEGIIPNFDKRVGANTEEQMILYVVIYIVERLPMQSLHLHLNSHLLQIIPPNGSILKERPKRIRLKPKFPHNLAQKQLAPHPQILQAPKINMRATIPNQRHQLTILTKGRMLIL
jgi:hypothetical protein